MDAHSERIRRSRRQGSGAAGPPARWSASRSAVALPTCCSAARTRRRSSSACEEQRTVRDGRARSRCWACVMRGRRGDRTRLHAGVSRRSAPPARSPSPSPPAALLPDVWIADARFWMTPTYLGGATGLRTVAPSVARSPVLLVGGPAAPRFAIVGRGGGVRPGVDARPVRATTAGSLAVVAPQSEADAVGRSAEAARQMIVPFAQKYSERRAARTRRATSTWRTIGPDVDATGRRHRAAAGRGAAAAPPTCATSPPRVGAPTLDFPIAVRQGAAPGSAPLPAPWAVPRHRRRARRPAPGGPPADRTACPAGHPRRRGLHPDALALAAGRSPATVQSWRIAQRALVDPGRRRRVGVHGRREPTDAPGWSVLADAAGIGLSFLPDHARVGLWVFSIDKGGPGQDWRVLEPMRRLDDLRFGRTQRYALRERARQIPGADRRRHRPLRHRPRGVPAGAAGLPAAVLQRGRPDDRR